MLNPIQVIDLLDDGLAKLKIFSAIPNIRIVVGGGDGTVASVVNYVKSGAIPAWIFNNPPVSVLPLGTGNDLGRCLGWGGGSEGAEYVEKYLHEVTQPHSTGGFRIGLISFSIILGRIKRIADSLGSMEFTIDEGLLVQSV